MWNIEDQLGEANAHLIHGKRHVFAQHLDWECYARERK